jgi:hypothetical protein
LGTATDGGSSDAASGRPTHRSSTAFAGAAALVVVAMVAGDRLTSVLPPAYVVSVFLVAVLVAAAAFGLLAGLFAAIASFFVFDFFFVQPTLTFDVADPREVFALGVFLAAAVLTGGLAGRLRETADAARVRAETLAMLHDFAERVSTMVDGDEVRHLVARQVATAIGGTAIVVDPRDPIGDAVAALDTSACCWPPAGGRAASTCPEPSCRAWPRCAAWPMRGNSPRGCSRGRGWWWSAGASSASKWPRPLARVAARCSYWRPRSACSGAPCRPKWPRRSRRCTPRRAWRCA